MADNGDNDAQMLYARSTAADEPSHPPPPPQQQQQPQQQRQKPPVQRGARACTVCRAAKMRCVGAEDGQRQCQRCKKQNLECIFEKHRRGRKPGSKLSESGKQLRQFEKNIALAKRKAAEAEAAAVAATAAAQATHHPLSASSSSSTPQLPFPTSASRRHPPYSGYSSSTTPTSAFGAGGTFDSPSQQHLLDDDQSGSEDYDMAGEGGHGSGGALGILTGGGGAINGADDPRALVPARLIAKENRHSFFRTILNPADPGSAALSRSVGADGMGGSAGAVAGGRASLRPGHPLPAGSSAQDRGFEGLEDPMDAGLVSEKDAKYMLDLVFLRLNPFINLFDPVLHTVPYLRSRSPFLFSCLMCAGAKFWKPDLYRQCQRIALDFSVRAFAEGWKSVETVQAFACMTYWKEPDDNRTWTLIGYACRMAVEIGLNSYLSKPPDHETEHEKRERRNRERTYLVLFVHDRSLSMQTGRQWMLPEDDLVRHSSTWHEDRFIRPEDVVVAAFVQLRRIAAETTDIFYLHRGAAGALHTDVNYDMLLRGCNGKLSQWNDTWREEMKRAGGQQFHFSLMSFFRLHVSLFLNSFGLQASLTPGSRVRPGLQALSACYTSALQTLEIVTKEFAPIEMLRYTQDSIAVMTAYSAVFLLKLLRRTTTLTELNEGAADKIYQLISQTADAYQDAAIGASSSSSAAYHSRFLRMLLTKDAVAQARAAQDRERKARDAAAAASAAAAAAVATVAAVANERDHHMDGPNPGYGASHLNHTGGSHPGLPTPSDSGDSSYAKRMTSPTHPPSVQDPHQRTWHFPASPHLPTHPLISPGDMQAAALAGTEISGLPVIPAQPLSQEREHLHDPGNSLGQGTAHLDQTYWSTMFRELGFGAI